MAKKTATSKKRNVRVVSRTLIRHQERHVLLEEGLSPQHQVREDGLIGRRESEMFVASEHVVHESRAAPPMAQDKERIHLQRFIGQFLVTVQDSSTNMQLCAYLPLRSGSRQHLKCSFQFYHIQRSICHI